MERRRQFHSPAASQRATTSTRPKKRKAEASFPTPRWRKHTRYLKRIMGDRLAPPQNYQSTQPTSQTTLQKVAPVQADGYEQGVPIRMTSSIRGAGTPNVMSHSMATSKSQQGRRRDGTTQMTQETPAMPQTTPIMRDITPPQQISHSTMAPTPGINQAIIETPQMGGTGGASNAGIAGLTPYQQQLLIQQRQQQLLTQQGHLSHGHLTPQQFAQLQANVHAQQASSGGGISGLTPQQQRTTDPQSYQSQLMRAQLAQLHMVQQQQQQQKQQQNQQSQGQQGPIHQGSPKLNAQQQMVMANIQGNTGHPQQNFQGNSVPAQGAMAQRYNQLFQQRLLRLRQEMANRLLQQYGPPNQYPPHLLQQYQGGLERTAKAWVQEVIRRDSEQAQQQRAKTTSEQDKVFGQAARRLGHSLEHDQKPRPRPIGNKLRPVTTQDIQIARQRLGSQVDKLTDAQLRDLLERSRDKKMQQLMENSGYQASKPATPLQEDQNLDHAQLLSPPKQKGRKQMRTSSRSLANKYLSRKRATATPDDHNLMPPQTQPRTTQSQNAEHPSTTRSTPTITDINPRFLVKSTISEDLSRGIEADRLDKLRRLHRRTEDHRVIGK